MVRSLEDRFFFAPSIHKHAEKVTLSGFASWQRRKARSSTHVPACFPALTYNQQRTLRPLARHNAFRFAVIYLMLINVFDSGVSHRNFSRDLWMKRIIVENDPLLRFHIPSPS
jgi:hypothetical protein